MLCLSGTGLGRETPRQIERYALALNCGKPCPCPRLVRSPSRAVTSRILRGGWCSRRVAVTLRAPVMSSAIEPAIVLAAYAEPVVNGRRVLFIGPALAYGFLRVLSRGPDYLVSVIVLFSVTQNVGGLLGSAVLGSYQVAATRAHAAALSEHLVGADPQVAARLWADGPAALTQALMREANVLAFNDVFVLVAAIAAATALFIACALATNALRKALK